MASLNSRIGSMVRTRAPVAAAALVAALTLVDSAEPAGAAPLQLSGAGWAAESSPATNAADDVLPDAPDLDSIPFFAVGDNAVYLRADAGFGALTAGSALTGNGRLTPGLSGPAIAGVGVGYRLGHLLRADITAEYRSRADIRIADGTRARLSGGAVLANLYADLGTWYGVTPYVGVGVGAAWNRFQGAGYAGRNRTDLVWAVGGGFSVALTPEASIDIGYRYLHTGTVRSPHLALRESGSHDLRLGLRWQLGKSAATDSGLRD